MDNLRVAWARIGSFEGLLGTIGVLVSTNATVAVLGFASLAMTAHTLSPAGLGLLALIEAYGRVFDQVLRLEPTQALIREATPYKDRPDRPEFRRLVRFSILMDVFGALLGGSVALLGLLVARHWAGLEGANAGFAALFCLVMLLPAPMTATGLLRFFSRFDIYARLQLAAAVAKLLGTLALFAAGAQLGAFVVLLCAVTAFERLAPSAFCWPLLRRKAGPGLLREPLAGVRAENPRLWSFIFSANLNVLARNANRQFDVLILGSIIPASEMGFYVLAKRIGLLAFRLAGPVQFVTYPRICELVEQKAFGRLRRLVGTVSGSFLLLAVIGLCVLFLAGEPLVTLFFGPSFRPALPLILVQAFGASLFVCGAILNAALQGLRRERHLLSVSVTASAVFFLPLPWLAAREGAMAAPLLFVAMNLVWLAGCALVFLHGLRAAKRVSAQG